MKNLILVGYMGSGKTAVSRILKERLNMELLDSDSLIEERVSMKISDIFNKQGENEFRRMETCLLEDLQDKSEAFILSTGGGMPLIEENRCLMKMLGTVIYLRAKPETIYARIKNDNTRPLLQTPDKMKKIEEMLERRKSFYEAVARHVIDTDGKDLEQVADEILELISEL